MSVLSSAAAVGLGLAVTFQDSLVFHPQRYPGNWRQTLTIPVTEVKYKTSQGSQVSFYVQPRSGTKMAAKAAQARAGDGPKSEETTATTRSSLGSSFGRRAASKATTITPPTGPFPEPPKHLWLLYGGNGSLALWWTHWAYLVADRDAAFFLVEYPGYGLCDGKPSTKTISETNDAAFAALAATFGLTAEELAARSTIGVGGHSMGCAAALQFASRHPGAQELVLAAPFTSLTEMARQYTGSIGEVMLMQNFDNRARLKDLSAQAKPPHVIIIHGDNDHIIPVSMARRLAAEFPKLVEYHEQAGGDHMTVLKGFEKLLQLR